MKKTQFFIFSLLATVLLISLVSAGWCRISDGETPENQPEDCSYNTENYLIKNIFDLSLTQYSSKNALERFKEKYKNIVDRIVFEYIQTPSQYYFGGDIEIYETNENAKNALKKHTQELDSGLGFNFTLKDRVVNNQIILEKTFSNAEISYYDWFWQSNEKIIAISLIVEGEMSDDRVQMAIKLVSAYLSKYPASIAKIPSQPSCGNGICEHGEEIILCTTSIDSSGRISDKCEQVCKQDCSTEVKELVKCIFQNSKSKQECYLAGSFTPADENMKFCRGIESCKMSVKDYPGEGLT